MATEADDLEQLALLYRGRLQAVLQSLQEHFELPQDLAEGVLDPAADTGDVLQQVRHHYSMCLGYNMHHAPCKAAGW